MDGWLIWGDVDHCFTEWITAYKPSWTVPPNAHALHHLDTDCLHLNSITHPHSHTHYNPVTHTAKYHLVFHCRHSKACNFWHDILFFNLVCSLVFGICFYLTKSVFSSPDPCLFIDLAIVYRFGSVCWPFYNKCDYLQLQPCLLPDSNQQTLRLHNEFLDVMKKILILFTIVNYDMLWKTLQFSVVDDSALV